MKASAAKVGFETILHIAALFTNVGLVVLIAHKSIARCDRIGQEMKIVFLVVGLVLGFGAYAVVDLRDDYSRSVELAEANCNILVLSDPNAGLAPTEIDCNLINNDYLLSFEVYETKGVWVECLPGAFSSREIVLGECNLYK